MFQPLGADRAYVQYSWLAGTEIHRQDKLRVIIRFGGPDPLSRLLHTGYRIQDISIQDTGYRYYTGYRIRVSTIQYTGYYFDLRSLVAPLKRGRRIYGIFIGNIFPRPLRPLIPQFPYKIMFRFSLWRCYYIKNLIRTPTQLFDVALCSYLQYEICFPLISCIFNPLIC